MRRLVRADERGGIAVWVAMSFIPILIVMALVYDVGLLLLGERPVCRTALMLLPSLSRRSALHRQAPAPATLVLWQERRASTRTMILPTPPSRISRSTAAAAELQSGRRR